MFADDINISFRTRNPQTAIQVIQPALLKLENWSKETGFTFSDTKTHAVVFHRKRTSNCFPPLYLYNVPLAYQNNTKFLGLIFDQRLSWITHFQQLKAKSSKILNLLKILRNRNHNPSRHLLLKVYKSLFRSRIEYGSPAFSSASKKALSILSPLHNTAIRLCLGALRSSPILSIFCEAGEEPPSYRRSIISNNYLLSVSSIPSHPLLPRISAHSTKPSFAPINEFLNFTNNHNLQINPLPFFNTTYPPWLFTLPKIDISLSSFPKSNYSPSIIKQHFFEIVSQYPDYKHCFTDGSKKN